MEVMHDHSYIYHINIMIPEMFHIYQNPEAYWVPLIVGGWIPYPLMLGGWDQPIICSYLPETAFQDIFFISYDAKKSYCAKRSSLRCYTTVHTLP